MGKTLWRDSQALFSKIEFRLRFCQSSHMNPLKFFSILSIFVFSFLATPVSIAESTNAIPSELRSTKNSIDKTTIESALQFKKAGWTFVMPEPKSPQAVWGNRDGRTTWWIGYWLNEKTKETSSTQPNKDSNGKLTGDGKGALAWRRGGTPPPPSKIEWLCSKSGGIPPH